MRERRGERVRGEEREGEQRGAREGRGGAVREGGRVEVLAAECGTVALALSDCARCAVLVGLL